MYRFKNPNQVEQLNIQSSPAAVMGILNDFSVHTVQWLETRYFNQV